MARNKYDKGVFINCPFDRQYKPLFEAIVFAVFDCGLWPSALEIDDASEVRIDKIFKIIADCKYGVHDISRTEVTSMSDQDKPNDGSLVPAGRRDLAPVAAANPLVSRGLADLDNVDSLPKPERILSWQRDDFVSLVSLVIEL